MGVKAKSVLLGAALYAVATLVAATLPSLLAGLSGLPFLVGSYLALLASELVLIALVSRWIARRTGDLDIVLPLFAWWLGSTAGNLVYWGLFRRLAASDLAGAMIRPLTLGFLAPTDGPIVLFTLSGTTFGLAFPWLVVMVYIAVFWNRATPGSDRPRKASSSAPATPA